jgi:hypothetical protein
MQYHGQKEEEQETKPLKLKYYVNITTTGKRKERWGN